MEEQQPRDHRVERLRVAERTRVRLLEPDVGEARVRAPVLRDFEQLARLVDPHDLAARPDEAGDFEGHVAEAGADVEYAHALADAGVPYEQSGGRFDRSRLQVEARYLGFIAAEHVLLRRARAHRRPPPP